MREPVTVLYSEEQIARRVAELGAEIGRAFEGSELCVLGLMKGSFVFMADLIRRIPLDLTVHLVRVSSQHEKAASRIMTEIVYATAAPLTAPPQLLASWYVERSASVAESLYASSAWLAATSSRAQPKALPAKPQQG